MTGYDVRFGFIGLEQGVRARHMWVLLYGAYVTIGLGTFDAFATPYVLSTAIGIPNAQQGAIVGQLNVYTELVLLIVFTPLGVLADRIGRRAVYALGFVLLAIGYTLFPYAGTVNELAMARVIYSIGLGAVTATIATLLADYAVFHHRGRLVGLVGVLNGLGVVSGAAMLGRLPKFFADRGYDDFTAGQYTLFIVSGLCLLSACILGLGLRPGTAVAREERPGVRELFKAGFGAAVRNPRIALAYASAFVARGDMVVVGTFLVLWGKLAAMEDGMGSADALSAGRIPFIVSQSTALLWAIAAIFMLDRFHRVTALVFCLGLSTAAYLSLGFVEDPLARANLPFFVLLGVGQISAFLGSQTLIGKEAPVAERGSVMGAYALAGGIGILITSGIGGEIFDLIGPRAPFILLGIMNGLVFLAAIAVRLCSQPEPGATPS